MPRPGNARTPEPVSPCSLSCTLTGYSIEDLLMQDTVLAATQDALAWLVPQTATLGCIIVVGAPLVSLNRIYNCAVVIHRGIVLGVVPKSLPAHLPRVLRAAADRLPEMT